MLDTLDISIVVMSILSCLAIGMWNKRKNKKNVENYLLADRKMSFVPASLSLLATMLAANNITSSTAEIFRNGAQYITIPVGFFIVQIFVAYWVVPILHNMEYSSIYEYLEYRFDKTMRIIYSLGFLLLNVVMNTLFLFVPAISITTLTDIPLWLTIIFSGLTCTLYCVLGGLRGVIWTDVFQTVLIVLGLLVVIIQGFVEMGTDVFRRTFENRSDEHFRFYDDGTSGRHNFFGILFFGISASFVYNFGNQASAQRLLCVRNKREATKTALLSVSLLVLMQGVVGITGIIVFAKITHCNPFDRPEERLFMPDQIYVYGAEKILKNLPGCVGILVAGLLSAALSTVSSNLNSFAAIIFEDYLKWWFPRLTSKEETNLLLCQVLTGFFGVLTVALAMIVPILGTIVSVMMLFLGALGGPLSGVLILAFFMKRAHATACKLAILISFVVGVWLGLGSYLSFKPKFIHLTHDTSGCHLDPSFGVNETISSFRGHINNSLTETNNTESRRIFPLYTISTMWYSPICITISALLGFCLSFCFEKPVRPDPRLVSHVILNKEEKEALKRLLEEKAERKQIDENETDTKEMQNLTEAF